MTAVTPDADTRPLDDLDWQPPCDGSRCNQPATWRVIPDDCRCTTWLLCEDHTRSELQGLAQSNRWGITRRCVRCANILVALDARRLG